MSINMLITYLLPFSRWCGHTAGSLVATLILGFDHWLR